MYYLPTPKSPHGCDVDPSGEYIVAGGKLAALIPVHSFSKFKKAVEGKEFDGEFDGIPIVKYESVIAGEVKDPGLGPLHTEFDGQGVRIHFDVPLFRDCEVEDRNVGSSRSHSDLLFDRALDDSRR